MHYWLIAICILGACGKSDGTKPATKETPPAGSNTTGTTDKPSVTGSVTLAGELAGVFQWKDDLSLQTCAFGKTIRIVELTMTDGADAFISLKGDNRPDNTMTRIGSAKLKTTYTQEAGGVKLSSTDEGHHITAQFDMVVNNGGLTVKGTLQFSCGSMWSQLD